MNNLTLVLLSTACLLGSACKGKGGDDKAAVGSGSASGDKAAAPGSELPVECDEYKAAVAAIAKCDKLPQATRDALKDAYEQMSRGWASIPADRKATLVPVCKAATDGLKQAGAACN